VERCRKAGEWLHISAIGVLEAKRSALGKSIINEIGHTEPRSSIRNQRMPKIPFRCVALARERVMRHERHRTTSYNFSDVATSLCAFILNFYRSN